MVVAEFTHQVRQTPAVLSWQDYADELKRLIRTIKRDPATKASDLMEQVGQYVRGKELRERCASADLRRLWEAIAPLVVEWQKKKPLSIQQGMDLQGLFRRNPF